MLSHTIHTHTHTHICAVTRDWTDGLLSNIFREMNKPLPEGKDERRFPSFHPLGFVMMGHERREGCGRFREVNGESVWIHVHVSVHFYKGLLQAIHCHIHLRDFIVTFI